MKTTGWAATVGLGDGFDRTLAYYRTHLSHYVDAGDTAPS
jgi:hypothetical protein